MLVPDLSDARDPSQSRWPNFAKDAIGLGVQAAFAFPLLLGASRLGALSLYRDEAGLLSPEHISHGQVTADAVALRLAEPGNGHPNGSLEVDPMRVHQAAGMVMVQLGVPIDQALLRLRAAAYADGQTVDELADAIVQRRRRLSMGDRGRPTTSCSGRPGSRSASWIWRTPSSMTTTSSRSSTA